MRLYQLSFVLAALFLALFFFMHNIRAKQHESCLANGGVIVQNMCIDETWKSDNDNIGR